MNKNKRILIFNVNWLGDVLFSTAAIRNIRYNYPQSFIACIIPPRCLAVLEGNENLNEIIVFDEAGQHKGIFGKIGFVLELRKRKFDVVFLLHRSFSRALITMLAGIRERIGYYTSKRSFVLTKKFIAPELTSVHRIEYYLNLIKLAGLTVRDRHTDFFVTNRDMESVEEFLVKHSINEDDFLVGINPGGNWDPKRWPKENFSHLADRLVKDFSAKIIITGGFKDLGIANDIKAGMKTEPIIACGKFDLKQFAVLAKIFNLFITADSGPLHIANAVGARKIIAIFGPTDPKITGPYPADNAVILRKDTGCKIPCYVVNCPDNKCMKAVTVSDVIEKLFPI
jgi:lipopolysaccharide heptosyltransferase II